MTNNMDKWQEIQGIYIHIPFCDSKCHYCSFNSYVDKFHLKELYMEALCVQLAFELKRFAVMPKAIESLFIGGGTPSTVSPRLYKKIFEMKKTQDYDIVYLCGLFSINFDPEDKKLGGSEQAVVNLSENWVKLGKSVVVYGEIQTKNVNGVEYKNFSEFNYNQKYKNCRITPIGIW